MTARDLTLLRRAARTLAGGPRHTLELAREVLGLEGHSGAASAAVFQLLGTDPRFHVDASGVWHLDPAAAPLGVPLSEVRFAVVDVETTGGRPGRGHRIVEIAIVEVQGGRVTDTYETLVNPAQAVPAMITSLTGITGEMVQGAPFFEHIADTVRARLEGSVFVAHNAAFDWSFVAQELTAAGVDPPPVPRLCTVRMVRRLVPELRSRNLDVVTRHFGVDIHARHRAYGDALATARVLIRLLDDAAGRGIDDLETLQWYLERRRRRRSFDPEQFNLGLGTARKHRGSDDAGR